MGFDRREAACPVCILLQWHQASPIALFQPLMQWRTTT